MKKKKILFINGHLNLGGVEKSLLDILRTIDTEHFDVELLLLEELGDYSSEIPPTVKVRLVDLHNTYGSLGHSLLRCIKLHDYRCFLLRIIFCLQQIVGLKILFIVRYILFRKMKYDYAVGFRPGICMELVSTAVPAIKKIGWWHHGSFNLNKKQYSSFISVCKHLDTLVTVSLGCKNMILHNCPNLQTKIDIIPNMIDRLAICRKADAFQPYTRQADEFIFVTVGRLSKEKHLENVIYASERLKKFSDIKFHWYIVGDGIEKDSLTQLISNTKTDDVVSLLGNKPNPYPYIKYADVFIHTSYIESQCLVALEAMALGKICVITKSLGTSEFVVDGFNAIYVEQNINSLFDGINKAINKTNKNILSNLEQTVMTYSPEKIYKKIEALFC